VKIDNDAQYTLGLYADYLGCAGVILEHKDTDGKVFSKLIRDEFYKKVCDENILKLTDFKNEYNEQHYFWNVYINNLPSLEKVLSRYSVYMTDIDMNDKIFKTTCLMNDNYLKVLDSIERKFLDNLNSFNPKDEKVNHRVMALFLALEGHNDYSWL
jgi:hypothetical protein